MFNLESYVYKNPPQGMYRPIPIAGHSYARHTFCLFLMVSFKVCVESVDLFSSTLLGVLLWTFLRVCFYCKRACLLLFFSSSLTFLFSPTLRTVRQRT